METANGYPLRTATIIVCVHESSPSHVAAWRDHCRPSWVAFSEALGKLLGVVAPLVEVTSQEGLTHAYERGRLAFHSDLRIYAHDDVELITDPVDAALTLLDCCKLWDGIYGVTGSALLRGTARPDLTLPWWCAGDKVGHHGHLDRKGRRRWQIASTTSTTTLPPSRRESVRASMLDGIVLAECGYLTTLPWLTGLKGWHGYDAARCIQAHHAGQHVRTLPWDALHRKPDDCPTDMQALDAALDAVRGHWEWLDFADTLEDHHG